MRGVRCSNSIVLPESVGNVNSRPMIAGGGSGCDSLGGEAPEGVERNRSAQCEME